MFEVHAEAISSMLDTTIIPPDAASIVRARRLRDRLDALIAAAEAEFDAAEAWREQGAGSLASWLRLETGMSDREAWQTGRQVSRLRSWPLVAAAWRSGRLSGGQVDELVRAVPRRFVGRFTDDQSLVIDVIAPADAEPLTTALLAAGLRVFERTEPATPGGVPDMLGGRGSLDAPLSVDTLRSLDPPRTPAQVRPMRSAHWHASASPIIGPDPMPVATNRTCRWSSTCPSSWRPPCAAPMCTPRRSSTTSPTPTSCRRWCVPGSRPPSTAPAPPPPSTEPRSPHSPPRPSPAIPLCSASSPSADTCSSWAAPFAPRQHRCAGEEGPVPVIVETGPKWCALGSAIGPTRLPMTSSSLRAASRTRREGRFPDPPGTSWAPRRRRHRSSQSWAPRRRRHRSSQSWAPRRRRHRSSQSWAPPDDSATLFRPAEIHGIMARSSLPVFSIGWSAPALRRALKLARPDSLSAIHSSAN